MRHIISLLESQRADRVFCATSKEAAQAVIDGHFHRTAGSYGYGFYCVPEPPPGDIVLEFTIENEFRILDLQHPEDRAVWRRGGYSTKRHDRHLWRQLVHDGIDGVCDDTGCCIFNPEAVQFVRVYAGVVNDPLEEMNTGELDEFALGGLKRCTAVTVNALLHANHLPGITLDEVPINHPGVLHILTAKGLAYRPYPQETGRSVQQFVAVHHLGDWYLLTPGHAMALIHGELFDAENKGADTQRKLLGVFQITRR
jgi:hypothetical protein